MASDANRHHERLTHDDRRDEILAAVRQTVVEDGLSRLSISAVASRAGCTRSLFYHYFPTKEDALQAVLDLSIDSFVEQLTAWNESRVSGDIEGSLDSVAHMLKNMIAKKGDVMSQSVVHSGNAALYASFVHRAAARRPWSTLPRIMKCGSTTSMRRSTSSSPDSSCLCAPIPMRRRAPSKTSSQAPCISRLTPRNIRSVAPSGSSPIFAWGRTHPRHRPAHSFMP